MIFITLLEIIILISNGFAILNEKRVLQKYGFAKVDYNTAHEGGSQHMKNIVVNWLMFARSMKSILILNISISNPREYNCYNNRNFIVLSLHMCRIYIYCYNFQFVKEQMDQVQKKQKIDNSDDEEILQEGEVDQNFEQRVQKLLYETDNGLNLYNKPVMPLIYYEFNEEIKQQAIEVISQDTTTIPNDKYEKYEKEAAKIWDKFYRHHENNFFKDRHYLEREIPELTEFKESNQKDPNKLFVICEMGCGVGNALFPMKKNYEFFKKVCGFDFSKRAIDVLKASEHYNENVFQACVCDLVLDQLPDFERPDLGTLIFVLSAISPENHLMVVRKIFEWMKPGSVLYFRDYGQYDFGQINLSKKKNRRLKDNFYVKHDGVRVYYFSNEEVTSLFTAAGFKQLSVKAHYRYIENRKTKLKMYRVWVQGRYLKE